MAVLAEVEDDLDTEAWIESMIAENGYAQISKHDPGSGLPGFAYTIGLEATRNVPELFCMGVAPDIAAQLFAICIAGHDAAQVDLAEQPQDVSGLIDGYRLRLTRVPKAVVAMANAVRPSRPRDVARMVQVMLPDDSGRFPNDATCDPRIIAAQDPDRLLALSTN